MSYIDNEKAKPIVFYQDGGRSAVVGQRADLYGIMGHPRLGDERWVVTSTVVDIRDDGKTIETRNTIYKLLEG